MLIHERETLSGLQAIEKERASQLDPCEGKAINVNDQAAHFQRFGSIHQIGMRLDARSEFYDRDGILDLDIQDPSVVKTTYYSKKNYFQAYLEAAVKFARARKRIVRLDLNWKPVILLPNSNEIWIDADDNQLRSFCSVPIHTILDRETGRFKERLRSILSPIDPDWSSKERDPQKFQRLDAFLWKVAVWTSNGRVPEKVKLDQPVFLLRWPNLTRFVIPPHALRVAALLVNRPMSLIDVAKTLHIRPQYVFTFYSAAKSIGLIGRLPLPMNADEQVGLWRKVLHRLKA